MGRIRVGISHENEFKQASRIATIHHAGTQIATSVTGAKNAAASLPANPHVKVALEVAKAASETSKRFAPVIQRVAKPHEAVENVDAKVRAHADALDGQRSNGSGTNMANAHRKVAKAAGIPPKPAKMGVTK